MFSSSAIIIRTAPSDCSALRTFSCLLVFSTISSHSSIYQDILLYSQTPPLHQLGCYRNGEIYSRGMRTRGEWVCEITWMSFWRSFKVSSKSMGEERVSGDDFFLESISHPKTGSLLCLLSIHSNICEAITSPLRVGVVLDEEAKRVYLHWMRWERIFCCSYSFDLLARAIKKRL